MKQHKLVHEFDKARLRCERCGKTMNDEQLPAMKPFVDGETITVPNYIMFSDYVGPCEANGE